METIADAREYFDRQLATRVTHPVQLECTLCEDRTTAMFYLELSDGDTLAACVDLSPSAAASFNAGHFEAAPVACGESRALH